jgi:hypothetical protein
MDGRWNQDQPQYRGMLAIDVEASGDPRRRDPVRSHIRKACYDMLDAALRDANVPESGYDPPVDRGDGVLLVFGPDSKLQMLDRLLPRLEAALRRYNHTASTVAKIRLRVAVHAGDVLYDPRGITGDAVYLLFRLLDSKELRDELAGAAGDLAVAVSDAVYQAVVKHAYGALRPEEYRQVRVSHKEVSTRAWFWTPDRRGATGAAGPPPAPPRRPDDRPTAAARSFSVSIGGDQIGDVVAGDKVMGNKYGDGPADLASGAGGDR